MVQAIFFHQFYFVKVSLLNLIVITIIILFHPPLYSLVKLLTFIPLFMELLKFQKSLMGLHFHFRSVFEEIYSILVSIIYCIPMQYLAQ